MAAGRHLEFSVFDNILETDACRAKRIKIWALRVRVDLSTQLYDEHENIVKMADGRYLEFLSPAGLAGGGRYRNALRPSVRACVRASVQSVSVIT